MTRSLSWMRMLRAVLVAGLLAIALVVAVLGAIGSRGHLWRWASDPDISEPGPVPSLTPSGTAYILHQAEEMILPRW